MNKLSLAGLIAGLLLVGILFFGVGFLAAVATYGTGKSGTHESSWAAANTTSSDTPKTSGLAAIVGSTATRYIKNQTAHLESKFGGGALTSVMGKVPAPLRPFAAQARNKAALAAQQSIGAVSSRLQGAFAPQRFGAAQQGPAPQATFPTLNQQQQIRSAFAPRYQAGNPPPPQPLHPGQTSPFAVPQQAAPLAPPPAPYGYIVPPQSAPVAPPMYAPAPQPQYAPMQPQGYPAQPLQNGVPNVGRY